MIKYSKGPRPEHRGHISFLLTDQERRLCRWARAFNPGIQEAFSHAAREDGQQRVTLSLEQIRTVVEYLDFQMDRSPRAREVARTRALCKRIESYLLLKGYVLARTPIPMPDLERDPGPEE